MVASSRLAGMRSPGRKSPAWTRARNWSRSWMYSGTWLCGWRWSGSIVSHPRPILPDIGLFQEPICLLASALGPAYNQAVDAAADVAQVGFVAAVEFANGAAGVPDFAKGLADGFPVHIAITEVHPFVAIFFALEVFQVHLDDALPQRASPVLRISVKHHIADVEPRLDPRTLKLLDVCSHLQRTQQKFVPDFFDGNHNF